MACRRKLFVVEDRTRATIRAAADRGRGGRPPAGSEASLCPILDNIQEAIYRTDTDGRIVWASPSCQRLWGYSPDAVIGTFLADYYVDPGERARFLRALEEGGGAVTSYEAEMRPAGGGTTWVSTNAHYYRDPAGNIAGVEGTVRDISELKRVRDALMAEKERALVTLASIGEGIITTDAQDRIEYLNPAAERLTGWDRDRARGQPLHRVYRLRPARDGGPPAADGPLRAAGAAVLGVEGGGQLSIEQTSSSLRGRGDAPSGRVIVFRDVTALHRVQRQLSYQATHDALTGLVNRYEFERRLRELVDSACRGAAVHALLYVDLDDFKRVNDTCGHMAGDALLERVSARLRRGIRDSDTLARLGGDEFGVLLAGCPPEKAEQIADKVLRSLRREPFRRGDRIFEIGASIGVVPIAGPRATVTGALDAADRACYLAKGQGGNRVQAWRPDDRDAGGPTGSGRWLMQLDDALRDDRLGLCARDAMRLRSADAPDYREVLLHMRDGNGTAVPAAAFLPAAERYHLLPRIDRWVLQRVLTGLAAGAAGDPGVVALDLSGQSLRDEEFLQQALDLLTRSAVCPSRICFQVAETAVSADFSRAMRFIAALKKLRCRIALDHFGNAASSFVQLRHLPVDFVRIDPGLVRETTADPVAGRVIRAIAEIARITGKWTIAPAVGNAAVLGDLEASGVDYALGAQIGATVPFA